MVSFETAKSILNKNGKTYTDEEVKKIIELFKFWTELEYNNYLKNKQHEKRSNL
jgi:ABC-type transporter MlaC component